MANTITINCDTWEITTTGHPTASQHIAAATGLILNILEIIGRNNSWDAAENIGAEICAHIGRELDMIAVKHP